MKIIKRGTEHWWVGQRATCPHCGTVVEFEDADDIAEQSRPLFGVVTIWFVATPCPACDGTIELTKGEAHEQQVVTRAEMV